MVSHAVTQPYGFGRKVMAKGPSMGVSGAVGKADASVRAFIRFGHPGPR